MKKFGIFVMAMAMVTILISCKPGNGSEPETTYVGSLSELIDKEVIIIHSEDHEQHQVKYDGVIYDTYDFDCQYVPLLDDYIVSTDNYKLTPALNMLIGIDESVHVYDSGLGWLLLD